MSTPKTAAPAPASPGAGNPFQTATNLMLTAERDRLQSVSTSFNGCLSDPEMPQEVKDILQPIVNDVNAHLKTMIDGGQILEAVGAGSDVCSSINWMAETLRRNLDLVGQMQTQLAAMVQKVKGATPATALNGVLDMEIQKRLTAGTLFDEPAVTQLKTAEYSRGQKEATESARVRADRVALLATNGIPTPADNALLNGDDAAFGTVMAAAKSRAETLKTDLGLALVGPFANLAFCGEELFASTLGQLRAARQPGTQPGRVPNPLETNPGTPADKPPGHIRGIV